VLWPSAQARILIASQAPGTKVPGFVAVLEGDLPSGRYIASELTPLGLTTASVAA